MTILMRIGSSSKETTEIGEASGMSLHNTRAEVEVVAAGKSNENMTNAGQ